MIGAETIIVSVISTSSCTWVTSFVVLVISDGTPNRPSARGERLHPVEQRRTDVATEPGGGAGTVEHRRALTDHLYEADGKHQLTDPEDVTGIPVHHTLVDDVGVQGRQVQGGDGLQQLQDDHDHDRGPVPAQLFTQKSNQHRAPCSSWSA